MSELNVRINFIFNALADAVGGVSQIDCGTAAAAIAGQVNNNGLGCYGTITQIAEAFTYVLFGEDYSPGSDFARRVRIKACNRLEAMGVDPDTLPDTVAS